MLQSEHQESEIVANTVERASSLRTGPGREEPQLTMIKNQRQAGTSLLRHRQGRGDALLTPHEAISIIDKCPGLYPIDAVLEPRKCGLPTP